MLLTDTPPMPTTTRPTRTLHPAEQVLLDLHKSLFPQNYDGEQLDWTAQTIEEASDTIEKALQTLRTPGFIGE